MCRMMYLELDQYQPVLWSVVKEGLKYWGDGNRDGTGLAWVADGGTVTIAKAPVTPGPFFESLTRLPHVKRVAGHVRYATSEVKQENTHPFKTCDGRSAFMHNGVLGPEEALAALQAELVARGHVFQGETDSEKMMHLLEETEPSEFMKLMREKGIRGSANWIYVAPERTYCFSDGYLMLVKADQYPEKREVAVFSDLAPFKGTFKRTMRLKPGTLVTIEDGLFKLKYVSTVPGLTGKNGRANTERRVLNLDVEARRPWYGSRDDVSYQLKIGDNLHTCGRCGIVYLMTPAQSKCVRCGEPTSVLKATVPKQEEVKRNGDKPKAKSDRSDEPGEAS